jgi:hypothetical protein
MPPKKQSKLLFSGFALLGSPYMSIIDLETLEAGLQDNIPPNSTLATPFKPDAFIPLSKKQNKKN